MPSSDVSNHAQTCIPQDGIGVAGHARGWLNDSAFLPLAAAGLAFAGIWLAADYAGVSRAIFAPQYVLELLVRDVMQDNGTECSRAHRSNGRRCTSSQVAEPAPLYEPFERAARKVLRHAGI